MVTNFHYSICYHNVYHPVHEGGGRGKLPTNQLLLLCLFHVCPMAIHDIIKYSFAFMRLKT
jgi:hypothetical protein